VTAFLLGMLTATIANLAAGLIGWRLYPVYLAARMVRDHAEHQRNVEAWLESVPAQRVEFVPTVGEVSGVRKGQLN
jgi:hypothetical protein